MKTSEQFLREVIVDFPENYVVSTSGRNISIHWIIEAMEKYAKQYINQWIPIEQEVPEREVLCLGRQDCMIIGYINKDEARYEYFAENDNEQLDNVTHWMHLPKPPK